MTKRMLVLFSGISLAVASAASNVNVNLYQPTTVNGTQFKPGEAKLQIKDNKAVLKQGKVAAEANVKVEENSAKFNYTTISYRDSDHQIKEICVGGTNTRIVFEAPADKTTSTR